MTEDEALTKIQNALNAAVDDVVEFSKGQNLIDEDILDSLDVISFLFELEEVTGLKFPETIVDEEDLMNVDKLAVYIMAKST